MTSAVLTLRFSSGTLENDLYSALGVTLISLPDVDTDHRYGYNTHTYILYIYIHIMQCLGLFTFYWQLVLANYDEWTL